MATSTGERYPKRYPKITTGCANTSVAFPSDLAAGHERLLDKIEALWGSREAIAYLDSLMLTDRRGRKGFTERVLRNLVSVRQLHETLYPAYGGNPHDPFSAATAEVARLDFDARRAAAAESARRGRGGDAMETAPASSGRPAASSGQVERDLHAPSKPWPEIATVDQLRQALEAREGGAAKRDPRRLGAILLDYGLVTEKAIETALRVQERMGKRHDPLGKLLQRMGVVGEEALTRALCLQSGIHMVDLRSFTIETATMKKLPIDVARVYRAVPLAILEGRLFLAVENPLAFSEREYFAFLTNLNIELVFVSGSRLTERLADYGQSRSAQDTDREFRNLAKKALVTLPGAAVPPPPTQIITEEDATVVGLVNKMINDAAAGETSDIHLEAFPGNGFTRIRFRRDGRLEDYSEFPAAYHDAVVSRIKIMSELDIAERRKPQDGKISYPRPGHSAMDLRVATIPTIRGIEDVTIRLLPAGEPMAMDAIGMTMRDLDVFRRMIAKPYGLILVSGPTGSGKTTTLHSALRELNTPDRKIWTAEDPVEIVQKNICQVQVNPKIGWTFANALRAFLRADPDVIMIGEMRDEETTRVALEASMTGHLVMTTVHTNSAAETVARLLDLGADPYNLGDALVGIMAQRLVRRLCPACVIRVPLAGTDLEDLAAEYYYAGSQRQPSFREREAIVAGWRERFGKNGELALWRPRGCDQCFGVGYRGRFGIYEVMEVTPEIRRLIRNQADAAEFLRFALSSGMTNLKQDGVNKALRGMTDMMQVRSACV